jgi:hypothetical protein
MRRAWEARSELAEVLTSAYGAGLLSELTLAHRLEELFSRQVIEPRRLIGDISPLPRASRARDAVRRLLTSAAGLTAGWGRREPGTGDALLLALDWGGASQQLLIGRHPRCDILLPGPHVSRVHAELRFRDGTWVLRDLGSRNGTLLNERPVGRASLRPGDVLSIGIYRLRVD